MASLRSRDVGVLAVVVLVGLVVVVLMSVMAYQNGRIDQQHDDDAIIALRRAEAFRAGRMAGDADAVALYTGGVAVDWDKEIPADTYGSRSTEKARGVVCRVTSNVRPVPRPAGQLAAQPRECRLLRDGSLWVPGWRTQ